MVQKLQAEMKKLAKVGAQLYVILNIAGKILPYSELIVSFRVISFTVNVKLRRISFSVVADRYILNPVRHGSVWTVSQKSWIEASISLWKRS